MNLRELNLARLNWILIPQTQPQRARLARSWPGRLLRPLGTVLFSITREGHAFATLGLLTAALSLDVRGTSGHVLWALMTSLVVATLVLRPFCRLRAVSLETANAHRVAVDEPLIVTLRVSNRGAHPVEALRTRWPTLTWDAEWIDPRPVADRIEPGATVRLSRRCTFGARGERHLGPPGACVLVPGGLATGRAQWGQDIRCVVLPRIAPVRLPAALLRPRHQPGGTPRAQVGGESMELVGVRPYRAGDPLRDLHARTWARVGQPHVREYQHEHVARAAVIVELGVAGDAERSVEAAIEVAAGALAELARTAARVDLVVLGDAPQPVTVGPANVDPGLERLAVARPAARAQDFPTAFAAVRPLLDGLASAVVVSISGDAVVAALVDRLVRHGVAVVAMRVALAPGSPVAGFAAVDTAAVLRGEVVEP